MLKLTAIIYTSVTIVLLCVFAAMYIVYLIKTGLTEIYNCVDAKTGKAFNVVIILIGIIGIILTLILVKLEIL